MQIRLLVIILASLAAAVVYAAIPPMINYQGKLLKPDGTAAADGTYAMTFAIYPVATGGVAVWSEPNPSVQVKKGLFSVLLGSLNPLTAYSLDGPERYFGVTVGTDAEMTPRQQITAVAYAFKAAVADNGAPVGAMTAYAGAAAPTGWLLCDGRAVSRTDYAGLFTAISTAYGVGDGTSTFNLPNLQGRVPVGLSTEVEFNALGKAGGEKTHTLTVAEMPSHSHGVSSWDEPGGDHDGLPVARANAWIAEYQSGSTGGNQPHNILQPYVVVQWIVKM